MYYWAIQLYLFGAIISRKLVNDISYSIIYIYDVMNITTVNGFVGVVIYSWVACRRIDTEAENEMTFISQK